MKIALCFYGLVGSSDVKYGAGQPLDPKICHAFYKKNFLNLNPNVDIFIHSQSVNLKKELIEIYKPKKFKIENQKNFSLQAFFHPYVLLRIPVCLAKFDFRFKSFKEKYKKIKNVFSRWYSTKEVIKLKKCYEKRENIAYDLVFLTRLDLVLLKPFILNSDMKDKLVVSHRNDYPNPKNNYEGEIKKNNVSLKKGLADTWFIGGNKIIERFSKLYRRLYIYHYNPHLQSLQHAKYLGLNILFWTYRGIEHNLIRRIQKAEM